MINKKLLVMDCIISDLAKSIKKIKVIKNEIFIMIKK
jgi:hypothetical protein